MVDTLDRGVMTVGCGVALARLVNAPMALAVACTAAAPLETAYDVHAAWSRVDQPSRPHAAGRGHRPQRAVRGSVR